MLEIVTYPNRNQTLAFFKMHGNRHKRPRNRSITPSADIMDVDMTDGDHPRPNHRNPKTAKLTLKAIKNFKNPQYRPRTAENYHTAVINLKKTENQTESPEPMEIISNLAKKAIFLQTYDYSNMLKENGDMILSELHPGRWSRQYYNKRLTNQQGNTKNYWRQHKNWPPPQLRSLLTSSLRMTERKTIVAYGIPTSLLESNSFFAACRDPEIPTKVIKLHNRKAVKLVYEDKQQADQVIERGYITIFKTQHRAVKPRHVKSNLCRVCKTVDCEKQNNCGNLRCGNCGGPHATTDCTIPTDEAGGCVVCGNDGHIYSKCDTVKYY